MTDETPPFDFKALESINEKAVQNNFFTPDRVYLDIGLFKDIPIGCIYAREMGIGGADESFLRVQERILAVIDHYQKRTYDTVDPYFASFGYNDTSIETILDQKEQHDRIFLLSPASHFLNTLIRHTIRNQNNSRPANKYTKTKINQEQYVMEPIPVTYWINIHPLVLSPKLLLKLAETMGEALGVNIKFLCKDPIAFDQSDWDGWMKDIDCFYLDSLGRFTRGAFVLKKQGNMDFVGKYFFARKRFEKCVMQAMQQEDFEQQVQMATAQLDIFCDFTWLQNNEVRLTEDKEDVPVDIPTPDATEKE